MSANETLAPSTHSAGDEQQLGRVYDMLTAEEALNPRPRHYLVGGAEDDPVELPQEVYEVLLHVVDAMRKGLSVTVSPTSQVLTTQQAADLLGISRPTLIKALDDGQLPIHARARTVGSPWPTCSITARGGDGRSTRPSTRSRPTSTRSATSNRLWPTCATPARRWPSAGRRKLVELSSPSTKQATSQAAIFGPALEQYAQVGL